MSSSSRAFLSQMFQSCMSNAKVSAFAKRRRLNDGSAVEAAGSDSSTSANLKTKTKVTSKKAKRHENVHVHTPLVLESSVDTSEALPDENSFEPLVEAQAVKFIGTREIEDNGRNSCKIRLSRGQECSFVGVANLWVRDGSIEVYGATLYESSRVYTIFAPYVGNAVSITSTSKTTEFQLEGIDLVDPAVPSLLNLPGRFKGKQNDLSFHIIDFQEPPASLHKPLRAVSNPVNHPMNRFTSILRKSTSSNNACVIVCGKRSSNTAYAALSLINAMLSEPTAYRTENGVAFLDLDQSSPIRTAPGTISLIHQRNIMLGPGSAYPLHPIAEAQSTLVSSMYTDPADTDCGSEIVKLLEGMISSHPEMRKIPLVIRTGKWFATASTTTLAYFEKLLRPSLVLSVDRTKSSPFYEAGVTIVKKDAVFEHAPELVTHATPPLAEHRHNLRSHFLFHNYVNEQPTWYPHLASLSNARRLELTIGSSQSQLRFLLISGGMIRNQDLADTLIDTLVTIVARDSNTSEEEPIFQIQSYQRNLALRHVGLAFIENSDESSGTVRLVTSVTNDLIERYRTDRLEVGLVLEKPGAEGQFSRHMLRD